jgi:hypothetical protein
MDTEIKVTVNFILSFLYDKLPRRRINLFGDELSRYIQLPLMNFQSKISSSSSTSSLSLSPSPQLLLQPKQITLVINNTDTTSPSLLVSALTTNELLKKAAHDSAIDLDEVLYNLPNNFIIKIEPDRVEYKYEDKLLSDQSNDAKFKVLYDIHALNAISEAELSLPLTASSISSSTEPENCELLINNNQDQTASSKTTLLYSLLF